MYSKARWVWEEKKAAHALGADAITNQISKGKDIMSILLKSNSSTSKNEKLPDEQLLGQVSTFIFAGSDTTSSALARTLHTLAKHPDVQDRLRKELREANSGNGSLGYSELAELPFLEAVCRETFRLYPPVTQLQRVAREDVVVPLAHPVTTVDGSQLHELLIPKDTSVFVNVRGANRDTVIWGPDAAQWRPERWLGPLPQSVVDAHVPGVYSNLLTFFAGPRSCIGFKFAELEMKVVLSQLVPTFRFSLPAKKEIVWTWGGVSTPVVKGSMSAKSELPLQVSQI